MIKHIIYLSLIFLYVSVVEAQILFPDKSTRNIEYSDLPLDKEGLFPIEMPKYDGVEQLIVLSSKWVIVVTNNQQEIVKKISDLSGGAFGKAVDNWEDSVKRDQRDWNTYRTKIEPLFRKWIVEAREQGGERLLDSPTYFKISSKTDPHYATPLPAVKTTRFITTIGQGIIPGYYDFDFDNYSYIELPYQMKSGDEYEITLGNGKKVTFLYDEKKTVSRAIKVNQMGYLPDATEKHAYLAAYLQELGPLDFSEVKNFYVINANTGKTALEGVVKLLAKNPVFPKKADDKTSEPPQLYSGEDIYDLDLSALKETGDFFISIPGVGRSWTFHHGADTYGEAFYKSIRGLYHQRGGAALEEPYTSWTRDKCAPHPVYESEDIPFYPPFQPPDHYEVFDIIGATIDYSKKTEDASGGWYDAADFDRNIHHYMDIFDLLNAYELAPQKFSDNQLNIPESGNGIPDILDEAEYGLLVWKKSMAPDGGVSGRLESWGHAPMCDPNMHYAYSKRTRWSSLIFAAAAAQFAELVKPFNAEKYKEYSALAMRAYEFGINPKNSVGTVTIHARKANGKGEPYTLEFKENDNDLIPYLIMAKVRLFILTEDPKFLEQVPDLLVKAPKPYEHPFNNRDFSPWFYFGIFSKKVMPHLPRLVVNQMAQMYTKPANELLQNLQTQPYRFSWPFSRNYWMAWGSNFMTNQARILLIAYYLTGNTKYRDAAILNADFMLGANPMGMSWVTGLGYVYPINTQNSNEGNGILDPVPGIAIYGVNGGMPSQVTNYVWKETKPDGTVVNFMSPKNMQIPVWRGWLAHQHVNTAQNEFTIHETMSGAIFTYAMLMSDQWMPTDELKERKPRKDKYLFGKWYLP